MKKCQRMSTFWKMLCVITWMLSVGAYADTKVIKNDSPCTTKQCVGDTVIVEPPPSPDPGSIGGPPSVPNNPVNLGSGGRNGNGKVLEGRGLVGGDDDVPPHTTTQNPAGNASGTTPVTPPTSSSGPTADQKTMQQCTNFVVYPKHGNAVCYDNPVTAATVYSCQGAEVSATKPRSIYCTSGHNVQWPQSSSCGLMQRTWDRMKGCSLDMSD